MKILMFWLCQLLKFLFFRNQDLCWDVLFYTDHHHPHLSPWGQPGGLELCDQKEHEKNGKICEDTARGYFREAAEHAKVPAKVGEAAMEDFSDGGEQVPAHKETEECTRVLTDIVCGECDGLAVWDLEGWEAEDPGHNGQGGRFPNFHQAPMGGDQVEQHVLYVEQGGLEAVQLCTKHVRNQIILAKVKKWRILRNQKCVLSTVSHEVWGTVTKL